MSSKGKVATIVVVLIAGNPAASAERMATISREAFACVSWAAWHEYGLASLTARGARMGKSCPLRLAAGTKVVVVDEDAGAGASEIRFRRQNWFVDSQRLR